jgi:hypothetical protein
MGCRPAFPPPGHGPTRQTGRRSHVAVVRSAEKGPDFARGAPTAGPAVPAALRGTGYPGQCRSTPCPILSRSEARVQCRANTALSCGRARHSCQAPDRQLQRFVLRSAHPLSGGSSRGGSSAGGTRSRIERALPGVRPMRPRFSSARTIEWTLGGVTRKRRSISASAGACRWMMVYARMKAGYCPWSGVNLASRDRSGVKAGGAAPCLAAPRPGGQPFSQASHRRRRLDVVRRTFGFSRGGSCSYQPPSAASRVDGTRGMAPFIALCRRSLPRRSCCRRRCTARFVDSDRLAVSCSHGCR